VNRHVEIFQIAYWNLFSKVQSALEDSGGCPRKMSIPIAPQPPGLGKTFLGVYMQDALKTRGRLPLQKEAEIYNAILKKVLMDPSAQPKDVSSVPIDSVPYIVKRMLLAAFPEGGALLHTFENASRVLVNFNMLDDCDILEVGFSRLLVNSVCRQLKIAAPPPGSATTIKTVLHWLFTSRSGGVFFVLDDFSVIFDSRCFSGAPEDKLTAALKDFARCTYKLLYHPDVFVYCTGRSASLCFDKLALHTVSPTLGAKVILQPLSVEDIREILVTTKHKGKCLYEHAGFSKDDIIELASCIYTCTGGVGRLVSKVCESVAAQPEMSIREAVESTRHIALAGASSLTPSGITEAFYGLGYPTKVELVPVCAAINRALAYSLIACASFQERFSIVLPGGKRVLFADIIAMFGLQVLIESASVEGCRYTIQAGSWVRQELLAAIGVNQFFNQIFEQLGGEMKGRAFELMVIEQICVRIAAHPYTHGSELTVGALLPCLSTTAAGNCRIPGSVRVVKLPKATASVKARLSIVEKTELLKSRTVWKGKPSIHPGDYAWLLIHWLPVGCLGVPQDSKSGCHDFFLRLEAKVIAFALKANCDRSPMEQTDIQKEIIKTPSMEPFAACEPAVSYVLVFICLHLGASLQLQCNALDAASKGAIIFPSLSTPTLPGIQLPNDPSKVFQVAVCDPFSPVCALSSLLGPDCVAQLQTTANRMPDISEVGIFLAQKFLHLPPHPRTSSSWPNCLVPMGCCAFSYT
jgi:hypothetical protein